jgi:hypothetical protein
MRMHFAMRRINHQPLAIWFLDKYFEQFFPQTFVAPAAKTALCIFPVPKVWRQITPWCTRAQNPKYSIDK